MKPSHLNQFFRDSLATRSGSTSARGMKNSSPMWPFLRTRLASLAPRAFSSSSSQAARAAVASLTARAAASRSTDALGAPGSPAPQQHLDAALGDSPPRGVQLCHPLSEPPEPLYAAGAPLCHSGSNVWPLSGSNVHLCTQREKSSEMVCALRKF